MRYKYIILGRDGVLNKDNEGASGSILSPEDIVLLPGVKESLNGLFKEGVQCFIFTQQSCVNRGLLSEDALEDIHNTLNKSIGSYNPIRAIYHCPHVMADKCHCYLPKPGLLMNCIEDHTLNKEDILVVSDDIKGYQAAKSIGLNFAFVKSQKHTDEEYAETGEDIFEGLPELVNSYYNLDVMQTGKEHSVYGLSLFVIMLEILGLFTYALTYQYF